MPVYQNKNSELVAAMRKHVYTGASKGVVALDTEDAKRLCDVAERGQGNPTALSTIQSTRAHAELQKGIIPVDAVTLLQLCDWAGVALKADPSLETLGCELPT